MNFKVISPETTENLMEVITENQGNKFRFGAGYTDLLLDIKNKRNDDLKIINLAKLNDRQFTSIEETDKGIRLGALVTAQRIIFDPILSWNRQYSVLCEAANKLASQQIRQVATIGGNLCTASPAGDIACALVALNAQCEILSANATTRIIPINDFFVDVRKTDLKKDEILRGIIISSNKNSKKISSEFIKVGTRRSMECAIVSLAYHIQTDKNDKITHAGIATGSVAPTIKFVKTACEYLIGKTLSSIGESEAHKFAAKVVEYASPISDIRASAWYRKEVLYNISKSIFNNI